MTDKSTKRLASNLRKLERTPQLPKGTLKLKRKTIPRKGIKRGTK